MQTREPIFIRKLSFLFGSYATNHEINMLLLELSYWTLRFYPIFQWWSFQLTFDK